MGVQSLQMDHLEAGLYGKILSRKDGGHLSHSRAGSTAAEVQVNDIKLHVRLFLWNTGGSLLGKMLARFAFARATANLWNDLSFNLLKLWFSVTALDMTWRSTTVAGPLLGRSRKRTTRQPKRSSFVFVGSPPKEVERAAQKVRIPRRRLQLQLFGWPMDGMPLKPSWTNLWQPCWTRASWLLGVNWSPMGPSWWGHRMLVPLWKHLSRSC